MLASQPDRTASITAVHAKQAKRVLRLFRRALTNQSSAHHEAFPNRPAHRHNVASADQSSTRQEAQVQNPAQTAHFLATHAQQQCCSQPSEPITSKLTGIQAAAARAQLALDSAQQQQQQQQQVQHRMPQPASGEADSCSTHTTQLQQTLQGSQQPVCERSSGRPLEAQQQQQHHQVIAHAHPQEQGSRAYLVETCIPWKALPLSSCYAPSPISFSFISSSYAASAQADMKLLSLQQAVRDAVLHALAGQRDIDKLQFVSTLKVSLSCC